MKGSSAREIHQYGAPDPMGNLLVRSHLHGCFNDGYHLLIYSGNGTSDLKAVEPPRS